MSAKKMMYLDRITIGDIKQKARDKRTEYHKLNDIIGNQIFNILELESKVLYYPLEDEEVWGFSETIKDTPFVCINTSIPYEKQIFAAAHELYHLWYENVNELILSSELEEDKDTQVKMIELKANRFAAEFLVPQELLEQEIRTYCKNEDFGVKQILKLADVFMVPFKTMLKRFYETQKVHKKQYEELMALSSKEVSVLRNRLGIMQIEGSQRIVLSDMVEKAIKLYEDKMITFERLEYLLSMSKLTIEKVGIEENKEDIPSMNEIDQIMEEEDEI